MRSSMSTYMRWPRWVERGVWWQILLVLKRLKAGAQRTLEAVRCSAGVEELPMGSLAPEPRAYGQSRGVIPFSCAYLAADASTRSRTSA